VKGVRKALETYASKQLPKPDTPKRRNKQPEKQTEKDCMAWMRQQGWDVHVIEASGGFNQYGAVTVKSGFSDACGNTPHGLSVFVEFKAQGKLRTLRPGQRAFLTKKIETNAFAVCVDGAALLHDVWHQFITLRRSKDLNATRQFLMSQLPPEPKTRGSENSELGF